MGGRKAPFREADIMPMYEFMCPECKVVEIAIRPVSQASFGKGCTVCHGLMTRIFSPPAVLNRSKPRSFKFDKTNFNANDQKLAALQLAESKGREYLKGTLKNFGGTAKQVLEYKKENFC